MKNDQSARPGENEKFSDNETDKRIYEHLTNKDDVISEDDIRRVRTDIGNDRATVGKEPGEQEIKKPAKEENSNDNINPGIGSAWDILDD